MSGAGEIISRQAMPPALSEFLCSVGTSDPYDTALVFLFYVPLSSMKSKPSWFCVHLEGVPSRLPPLMSLKHFMPPSFGPAVVVLSRKVEDVQIRDS